MEERISHLRNWFSEYAAVFSELAASDRTNTSVLMNYYTAPARYVGLSADMVMRSPEAIYGYGGIGAEIETLRRAGVCEMAPTAVAIRLVNARAAILEVTWRRTFLTGASDEYQAIYIAGHAPEGWRFSTVIEQSR